MFKPRSRPSAQAPAPAPAPPQPQGLQTIDPTALAGVSGGARSGRAAGASSSSSGGGGGGSSGGDDALLSALSGVLDSLHSLSSQPQRGFSSQEMMLFMMMLQQRNSAVAVAQPALPVIYSGGKRVF